MKLQDIEVQLQHLLEQDKRNWTKVAQLLIEIERYALFKEKAKSFTQYVKLLAKSLKIHESNLWRIKKAGEYYLAVYGTDEVNVIDTAKTSPEQIEIFNKIKTVAPVEVIKDLEEKLIAGTTSRRDLRAIWSNYRPASRHKEKVTSANLLEALKDPGWITETLGQAPSYFYTVNVGTAGLIAIAKVSDEPLPLILSVGVRFPSHYAYQTQENKSKHVGLLALTDQVVEGRYQIKLIKKALRLNPSKEALGAFYGQLLLQVLGWENLFEVQMEETPLEQALRLIDEGQSLFITGSAGTGKTTLVKRWLAKTDRRVAIVAPTGIAARNVGGVTLHSFFQFPPRMITINEIKRLTDPERRQVLRRLDTLVIDEVSMVTSLMLDNIDASLRKNRQVEAPFGGVQVLLVGDLFQLPPVMSQHRGLDERELLVHLGYESEWFFSAHSLPSLTVVALQKVYRQTDAIYLAILNRIRIGQATPEDFEVLNSRVLPNFQTEGFCMTLTTTNAQAALINENKQSLLKGSAFVYQAEIEGQFNEKDCPAEKVLTLRPGAQVMFIANDKDKRYVNGTMGKIKRLNAHKIVVDIEGQGVHEVEPEVWENVQYVWKEKRLDFEVVGRLKQFPLKLAYAVTVHKSQGLQFSHLVIDSNKFFAPGQLYVALSRCQSLEGLVLRRPLKLSDMKVDSRVVDFMKDDLR